MSSRLSLNSRSTVSGVGLADDCVLDLVDGVADPVGEREVAVDEVVRDGPQQVIRTVRQDRSDARRQVVAGPGIPVGVVDGEQVLRPEHDVELGRQDLIAVGQMEEDDVDDAVGRLDLRPLIAFQDVLDDEGVEPERLADVLGLGRRRGDQVDPDRCLGPAQQVGQRGEGRLALRFLDLRAGQRHDPDRPGLAGRPDRALASDVRPERDGRPLVRGRVRFPGGRSHRQRVLREAAVRRHPAYAAARADCRPGSGSAGWPRPSPRPRRRTGRP